MELKDRDEFCRELKEKKLKNKAAAAVIFLSLFNLFIYNSYFGLVISYFTLLGAVLIHGLSFLCWNFSCRRRYQ